MRRYIGERNSMKLKYGVKDKAQECGEKRPEQVGYIKYILYINIINWGR